MPNNRPRIVDPRCERPAASEGPQIGELFSIPKKSVKELITCHGHDAYYLSSIVEGLNELRPQKTVITSEIAEVSHLAVLPEEGVTLRGQGVRIHDIAGIRSSRDLA